MRICFRWAGVSLLTAGILMIFQGCATNPEAARAAEERAQNVDQILTQASDYAQAKRCLGPNQYRSIRVLDDQHILFEGRKDQMWVNTLPIRCPGLRRNSTLVIERATGFGSLCKMDSISVYEWFDGPWYSRMPWRWSNSPRCGLGEFQPITPAQLQSLEKAIKSSG
jgi:uncharacterized protein DUF6491